MAFIIEHAVVDTILRHLEARGGAERRGGRPERSEARSGVVISPEE